MEQLMHFSKLNPYNILAYLIKHLSDNDPDTFRNATRRLSVQEDPAIRPAVESFFKEHPDIKDIRELLSSGFPEEIWTAIQKWEHYGKFFYVFELLMRLDQSFSWEYIIQSPPVSKVLLSGFESLNDNAAETGLRILPRVPSIHDTDTPAADDENPPTPVVKHWVTDWSSGINQDLKNTYYICEDNLSLNNKKYRVWNHVVDQIHFESKTHLRIAVSPIVNDAKLQPKIYPEAFKSGSQNLFSVEALENSERIHQRIRTALLKACEEKVDILVFPEMLGDSALLNPNQDYSHLLDSYIMEAETKNWPAPFLIVAPTWWHDQTNELFVFNNTATRLLIQQKQTSFPFKFSEKEYAEEDLSKSIPEVHVLHIPDLGRLTFPICRDFLDDPYRSFLSKTLWSTFLICPAFSPAKTMFSLLAPTDIAYGCHTIWINTCSALYRDEPTTPEYVGFASCPMADGVRLLNPSCEGNCGNDSDVCLFLIDIGLSYGVPEIKVHNHIHGSIE